LPSSLEFSGKGKYIYLKGVLPKGILMVLSKVIANKSVHAAVAAIEIYNKPNFQFREEAFSLLMTSAWELLLKAKWLADHKEKESSLLERDAEGKIRLSRSGNPCTHSLSYLAAKLLEDKSSGFDKPAHDNVIALIEIRDTSAHFVHKDLQLGRRVLEVATASLQNYLLLVQEWFQIDLSKYNFFLMPLSFYHGFEAMAAASVTAHPKQVQRLFDYLDSLIGQPEHDSTKHVALRLETRFVKSKNNTAISFRWTDNPKAPMVQLSEEDVLRNYPLTYRALTDMLRRGYSDFKEGAEYHRLRRKIEQEKKYCIIRVLDPRNPKSSKQRFYNANIIVEFDKHFNKKKKNL
jgi:hypothetical protein